MLYSGCNLSFDLANTFQKPISRTIYFYIHINLTQGYWISIDFDEVLAI